MYGTGSDGTTNKNVCTVLESDIINEALAGEDMRRFAASVVEAEN